jgi:Cu(I)/Ag(I) efflux system membrane protein CusA/SilA
MVGGMVTSPILSMLFIPAAFRLLERRRLRKRNEQHSLQPEENQS